MTKYMQARTAQRKGLDSAVKEARVAQRITQGQLAESAGVRRATLIAIEARGKTFPSTAYAIAAALGVDVDDLFEPAE